MKEVVISYQSKYADRIEKKIKIPNHVYEMLMEEKEYVFQKQKFKINRENDKFVIPQLNVYLSVIEFICRFLDCYWFSIGDEEYDIGFHVFGNPKILLDYILISQKHVFPISYKIEIFLDSEIVYYFQDFLIINTSIPQLENWLKLVKQVDPQDESGMLAAMVEYYKPE